MIDDTVDAARVLVFAAASTTFCNLNFCIRVNVSICLVLKLV